jgi:hypothetical protein
MNIFGFLFRVFWPYLRGVMLGSTLALVAVLVSFVVLVLAYRSPGAPTVNKAVGVGVIQMELIHSPLFWIAVCASFAAGLYMSLRATFN